jgi:hypothetical protein
MIKEVTAVKLDLPSTYKIHPVFHVSLLKKFKEDGRPLVPPPISVDTYGVPIFEAEKIVGERTKKEGRKLLRYFQVRWKGYTPEHDTWEREDDILGDELIPEWRKVAPGPAPDSGKVVRASSGRPKRTSKAPPSEKPPEQRRTGRSRKPLIRRPTLAVTGVTGTPPT